jgi:hypothetical protein
MKLYILLTLFLFSAASFERLADTDHVFEGDTNFTAKYQRYVPKTQDINVATTRERIFGRTVTILNCP